MTEVIAEAGRKNMQVVMRPTTMPSPHGLDGPITIETSADGRTVVITMFAMREEMRQQFVAAMAGINHVQIINERSAPNG